MSLKRLILYKRMTFSSQIQLGIFPTIFHPDGTSLYTHSITLIFSKVGIFGSQLKENDLARQPP